MKKQTRLIKKLSALDTEKEIPNHVYRALHSSSRLSDYSIGVGLGVATVGFTLDCFGLGFNHVLLPLSVGFAFYGVGSKTTVSRLVDNYISQLGSRSLNIPDLEPTLRTHGREEDVSDKIE